MERKQIPLSSSPPPPSIKIKIDSQEELDEKVMNLYVQGVSIKLIAEKMYCATSTVYNRIRRYCSTEMQKNANFQKKFLNSEHLRNYIKKQRTEAVKKAKITSQRE